MNALVVVPTLDGDALRGLVATMHPDVADRLLVVDATQHGLRGDLPGALYRPEPHGHPRDYEPARNIGVARTMNLAARWPTDPDVVVWLSTSVRFGPAGGRDLLQHAADAELGTIGKPCALHAFALTRAAFDLVGLWDENFYPGYYEDTDWRYRLHLAGGHLPEQPIDAQARDGHGYDVLRAANPGRTVVNFDALKAYYTAKWGGCPPEATERYRTPFDAGHSLRWWVPAGRAELIDRYGLGLG